MQVIQVLIGGIAQGCIYGLIALGFVLIYKATETVSFAQGDLMMLGSFVGLALLAALGWPFWIAVPSVIAAMALMGIVLERVVIRPILGQPARQHGAPQRRGHLHVAQRRHGNRGVGANAPDYPVATSSAGAGSAPNCCSKPSVSKTSCSSTILPF